MKSASAAKPSGMLVVRNDNGANSFHVVRAGERKEREGRGEEEKKVERH